MESTEYTLIKQQLDVITTLVNAQFKSTHERLDKINGRVGKSEDEIRAILIQREKDVANQNLNNANHTLNCPVMPKIRVLEDNQLTQKAIKRWIIASIGITASIVSILFILIKAYFMV